MPDHVRKSELLPNTMGCLQFFMGTSERREEGQVVPARDSNYQYVPQTLRSRNLYSIERFFTARRCSRRVQVKVPEPGQFR